VRELASSSSCACASCWNSREGIAGVGRALVGPPCSEAPGADDDDDDDDDESDVETERGALRIPGGRSERPPGPWLLPLLEAVPATALRKRRGQGAAKQQGARAAAEIVAADAPAAATTRSSSSSSSSSAGQPKRGNGKNAEARRRRTPRRPRAMIISSQRETGQLRGMEKALPLPPIGSLHARCRPWEKPMQQGSSSSSSSSLVVVIMIVICRRGSRCADCRDACIHRDNKSARRSSSK
jgi:hypothetical protein